MDESADKNMIDKDEYPQTAAIEEFCVRDAIQCAMIITQSGPDNREWFSGASYAAGRTIIAEHPIRDSTLRFRSFVRRNCARGEPLSASLHVQGVEFPRAVPS
jgi:hypothetical protein